MARPVRVFQIAKELNISHTEILSFLKEKGVKIASHMSPVEEEVYQLILTEFAKDKEAVDRFRKEQVRREIQDNRVREKQTSDSKLKILSLSDQRKLEEKEKEQAAILKKEEAKRLEELQKLHLAEKEKKRQDKMEKEEREKAIAAEKEKIRKEAETETKEKAKSATVKETGDKQQKLRKVDLSALRSKVGQSKRDARAKKEVKVDPKMSRSAKDRVRQTMASIDTKTKKKVYRRERSDGTDEALDLRIVRVSEFSSVDELSKIFDVSPSDIIQKCFSMGVLATINQRLEWEAIELLSDEFGYTPEKVTEVGEELFSLEESEEDLSNAKPRSPVVTIMGHVDHGKTSLLDYIRDSNIVAGESGGITQHIGAYKVDIDENQKITFLDTPGHEAFTAMRARGAQVTDIVVLVVAADDSVMPQTIEAIDHANAAGVPIVVAINKMDKPGADADKVKRELSDRNVLVEDWGGKVQSIEVSAKTGEGVQNVLNAILMEAEMLELKANWDCIARGTVIDSRLDKGHGPVATVLIQKGTLNVGDPFICNDYGGKIRAIMNERGQRIKVAYPSDAVQLLGFEQVPQAADIFAVVENEKDIKRIASDRQRLRREIDYKKMASSLTLDAMSVMIKEGAMGSLPLIIKGDVDGSVEALAETFQKLNTSEVGVNVIRKTVGMINESDVLLAEASKAVIIGFHVQVSSNARLQAKQAGVEIRTYNIIYNAVEDIRLALEGLLKPDEVEEINGKAIVQTQFKIPKIGFIAGCKVTEGLITRNAMARLIRDEEEIYKGKINSLKRFKDDAREVKDGLECGIGIEGVSKYLENDIIEVFEIKQIKRKLEAN